MLGFISARFRRLSWQFLGTPNQIVSFEEALTSQVVQYEALTRLLVENGVSSKEELLKRMAMVGATGFEPVTSCV